MPRLASFVDLIGVPHFFSLPHDKTNMGWKRHRLERKGEYVVSPDVLHANSITGPRPPLPAFEFPSAAALSAAEGKARDLQHLAE
jgi:hypothetical protein